MKLFEAIVEANHRALAGDAAAGLHPAEFADELPIVALTCIDPRLNPLFPDALGVAKEHFIWLRNAGNIITGPLSSTMRSLALACAVKGGKEIAIIGHNDCLVCKTSTMNLTDAFRALGVDRAGLPENLTEFFGLFASERQNVIKAVEFTRHSPLIGPRVPVHGLLVDIETGKLEWVVNGYQALEHAQSLKAQGGKVVEEVKDAFKSLADFKIGEMKFPETKIGETTTQPPGWPSQQPPAGPSGPMESIKPPPGYTPSAPYVPAAPYVPSAPYVPAPKYEPPPRVASPSAVPPVVRPVPPPPPGKKIPVPPPVRPAFKLPRDKRF